MAYQTKFKKKGLTRIVDFRDAILSRTKKGASRKFTTGFTLIELIIVLGIFAIFFALSESVYVNLKASSNLKIGTMSLVQSIRYAQNNADATKNDSKWGVEILSNQMVVFKGNSYATRDVSADQLLDFPKGITASGISEIVFEKMTGFTNNTGTVTLTNNAGVNNIIINGKGTLTY